MQESYIYRYRYTGCIEEAKGSIIPHSVGKTCWLVQFQKEKGKLVVETQVNAPHLKKPSCSSSAGVCANGGTISPFVGMQICLHQPDISDFMETPFSYTFYYHCQLFFNYFHLVLILFEPIFWTNLELV